MPVTRDITATYRGPAKVVARLLDMGPREDRALAFLMAAVALMFIAQWPWLARKAHMTGEELNGLLAGSLFGIVMIGPLLFYGIAAISHLIAKLMGGQGSFYGARLALFWALLSSTPLILLYGLTKGFIGPGPAEQAVGVLWCLVFGWFWLSGLRQAEKGQT